MKNTISLWKEIIPSPVKGFSQVKRDTSIALPFIIVILLAIAASFLLLPVITSDAYVNALVRVQKNAQQEQGMELSSEQTEAMTKQLTSGSARTITTVSSIGGGVIGYILMLFLSMLLLKLVTVLSREKIELKLLFRIIIIIALFTAVQMFLKNLITLVTDYERILSRVQSTEDLQWALTSPVSLAALLSPSKIGAVPYLLIDSVTDIFNWLYYGYLYAALRGSAGLTSKKALAITLIFAVITLAVGIIITQLV